MNAEPMKPGSAFAGAMKPMAPRPKINVPMAKQHLAHAMAEPDMAKKQAHLNSAHMALGGTMPSADVDDT